MIHIKCGIVPHTTVSWSFSLRKRYSKQFEGTFGVPIFKFIDVLTGFNEILFSRWIRPKENESTRDAVLDRHGQGAVKMIEGLMSQWVPPDPVETWTNNEFDMGSDDISHKGFSRCEYSFRAVGGDGILEGSGYHKGGLTVHRGHHSYSPYAQCHKAKWLVSTMQGIYMAKCSNFWDAKRKAAIFALALDWTRAQSMNMTDHQIDAAKRVWKFCR